MTEGKVTQHHLVGSSSALIISLVLCLSQGFVLVYSITAQDTFEEMGKFKEQIEQNKGKGEKVPIALVGNKIDLESERKVTTEAGEALANEWRNQPSDTIGEIMFM